MRDDGVRMPITLITGPANAGKAELVMEAVREPLLVVPRRVDVEHYRRELAGQEVCLGVAVLRFRELIGELVQRAGPAGPVLSTFARERALALLAAEHGHRGSPGFSRALAELIGELQLQRVTPRGFSEAIGAVGCGRAEAELAELYGRYRALLEEAGYLDEEQRTLQALDELRRKPALWGARPVLLYGFDDLTPLQLDVIETLGARVDADVCVSLAYEPGRVAFGGRAGSFHALAPVAREHRALGARAEHYAPAARSALGASGRRPGDPRRADRGADAVRTHVGGQSEDRHVPGARLPTFWNSSAKTH